MGRVQGKKAFITGGAQGLGEATARMMAREGAKVTVTDVNGAGAEAVAASINDEHGAGTAFAWQHDVTNEAQWQEVLQAAHDAMGGLNVLVNNAGISQRSLALETSMEVYRQIIDIDLVSQIELTQAILPKMVSQGGGKLVFISSIAGKVGVPLRTAYSAAKFGLIGYADALRAELSQRGVGVHVVCPGSVATDVSRNALTGDGEKRGRSDRAIDNGIQPAEAAKRIVDEIAQGQREIIIAQGMEEAMGEMRRTPDELLDQVAAMVAAGYMEKMQGE